MNNPRNWSDDEIRDYFDSHPNLRMQHLARMTGKSMHELKRILMPGRRQAAPASPRFSKEDAEYWAAKRKGDILDRLKTTQVAFDHRLRELPARGNPKHFEWGFEDWWSQAEPALEMPKDRYYVLGFLYADNFGRTRHPEWDGRLASAKRVASRFMEASDFLSWAAQEGKRIGWRVTQKGDTVYFQGGIILGSYRGDVIEVKVTTDNDGDIAIEAFQVDTQENRRTSLWGRIPYRFGASQEHNAKKYLSKLLRRMYRWEGKTGPKSPRLGYRSDRVEGPGGLIFTWDGIRGGLGIRTQAEDPYGQVYSSTITLSSSGKLALKALARMWADPKMKREILSKRKPYDAVDFIDRTISEMGVRGRLKWHTKHYPD